MSNSINSNINIPSRLSIYNKEKNDKSFFEKGNIITGEIVSKNDDTVSIKSDKFTFSLPSNAVKGEVNDNVNFEVLENIDGQIKLKQVLTDAKFEKTMSNLKQKASSDEVLDMFKKSNFVQDETTNEDKEKIELEKQAVRKIQRAISQGQNVPKNVVAALQAQGLSVDKVSMHTLSKLTTEKVAQPTKDKSVEELDKLQETLEKTNAPKEEIDKKMEIANHLNDNGFEVSEKNINKIFEGLKVIDEIRNNADKVDVNSLLANEKPLTVENLLANKTNVLQDVEATNTEDLTDLVTKFLNDNELEVNKTNLDIGKMFINNEIPLTKENIDKYNFVVNELSNVSDKAAINALSDTLNNEMSINDIDLQHLINDDIDFDTLQKIVDQIKELEVEDGTFAVLDKENIKVTLKNIIENIQTDEETSLSLNAITNKRLFAEIQLKMTLDSAVAMKKNGIDIQTEDLQKIVEELRKIENQVARQTLSKMKGDMAVNDENVEKFIDTVNSVKQLDIKQSSVFRSIIEGEVDFNIEGINNVVKSLPKSLMDQMTVPNAKFSDSFSKVRDQIEPLLQDLGIEPTDNAVKASSILIKNSMDVTDENISKVEETMLKLDMVKDKFTPNIIASMLGDGINPLNENIDDVISYIDVFNEVNNESNNEKLLSNLAKMDKDKNVSDDTYNAVKSIYKALNQIDKYGVASVGTLLKAEHSLTLNNLLDSAKYYKTTGAKREFMDVTLSDTDDIKSKVVLENKNIKSVTERGVNHNKHSLEIQKLIDNSDYSNLKQLVETNENVFDEVLEVVNQKLEEINAQNNTTQDLSELQDIAKNIFQTSPETLKFMFDNNIVINKKNINNLKKLENDNNKLSKNIQELKLNGDNIPSVIDEDVTLKDSAIASFDVLIGDIQEEFELSELDTETIDLAVMQRAMTKNGGKTITHPIKLNGTNELTNLNVFLSDENALDKDIVTMHLSIFTEKLKDIKINAEINKENKSVTLNISCSENAKQLLKQEENTLNDLVKQNGINEVNVVYDAKVSNEQLFKSMMR